MTEQFIYSIMLHLTFPNISHRDRSLAMIEEWWAFESIPTSPSRLFAWESYEDFLHIVDDDHHIWRLPGIPATLFFFMEDEAILWAISLWHSVDHPDLSLSGSSISYWLRPSARGKWLAREMLSLWLIEARKLGIEQVLISADEDNPASWKTIESCGWVFLKKIEKEWRYLKIYTIAI